MSFDAMSQKSENINVSSSQQQTWVTGNFRGQDEEKEAATSSVPLKYRGTHTDQREMVMLGKDQVLRVCFFPPRGSQS